MSAAPVSGIGPAPIPAARLAQIRKTAQQFEAIFVRQMLSAARKSSFGDTVTSNSGTSSQGTDTFMEMADSHFADIASQKGSFGLGAMIEKQLIRQQQRTAGAAPVPFAPVPSAPVPAASSTIPPNTKG